MNVVIVMPSRGRPRRAAVAIQAIRDTAVRIDTRVVLVVDADDPELPRYQALTFPPFGAEVSTVVLQPNETGSLVKATNTVAMRIAREDPDCIIGNLGDDHLCRTPGWDKRVMRALATPGVAYGDDLLQGQELPTAPFISAQIVLALGYYALPDLDHMFVDNVWRDVGAQTHTLRFLPDVVIEHVHPAAGKAEWDDGYKRVNAESAIAVDHRRYYSWRKNAMLIDIGRVRAALGVAA
jgi:hypothetical protein